MKKEQREELAFKKEESHIEILGMQEHRIFHEKPFRYEDTHGALLITLSAWKNGQGASIGGIGFIISSKAKKSFLNIKSFGRRVIVANFSGNPATTVINAYSPTNIDRKML